MSQTEPVKHAGSGSLTDSLINGLLFDSLLIILIGANNPCELNMIKPRAIYRPALAREDFILKIFRLRNRIRLELDALFKPLGITDATWRVLFFLHGQGMGIMQKDLARELGIEGPTLVRLLDRLEEQKLIVRKPAPHDRRGKTVHLTDAAEPVITQLEDISKASTNKLLDSISDQDLDICLSVLNRLLAAPSGRP